MLQDRATSDENHERFLRRVVASREVWGLERPDGWAVCDSNEDDDASVLVFWSDEAYAKRAAKGEWASYVPTAIPLATFLERWLPGMHAEGTRVGTNWDANLCGVEVAAVELESQLRSALAVVS